MRVRACSLCVFTAFASPSQGCSCRTPTARSASSGFGRRTRDCTPALLATSVAASTPQPPSRSLVRQASVCHALARTHTNKHTSALNLRDGRIRLAHGTRRSLAGVPRTPCLEIPVALELKSSRPAPTFLLSRAAGVLSFPLHSNQIKVPVAALFSMNHFSGLASAVMMNGLIARKSRLACEDPALPEQYSALSTQWHSTPYS